MVKGDLIGFRGTGKGIDEPMLWEVWAMVPKSGAAFLTGLVRNQYWAAVDNPDTSAAKPLIKWCHGGVVITVPANVTIIVEAKLIGITYGALMVILALGVVSVSASPMKTEYPYTHPHLSS